MFGGNTGSRVKVDQTWADLGLLWADWTDIGHFR